MGVSVKVTGGDKFMAALKNLANLGGIELKVGVLEGATDSEGELIALRAVYNEFGTENIPARPAFRNTVAAKSPNWAQGVATLVRGRMAEPGAIEGAFQQLGEVVKGDIQDAIGSGVGPALKKSTVAAKTRKGLAAPALQLVEEADYQNSINYEVNSK